MASSEMIKAAFTALEISGNTILLTQGVEGPETACDQFVGVSLVADIPNHPILVQIKGLIQRQGEFHHPETRAEMATTGGDHLQMALSDLTGNVLEFSDAETMQLIRMGQISEMHAQPAPIHAIYGVHPGTRRHLAMKRMEG